MRIPDAYTKLGLNAPQAPLRTPPGQARGATSDDAPPQPTEPLQVHVSARGRELSLQSEDVNNAKVARLKASIESGSFQIDPQVIADRIVRGG
jgi:flagellar biosynthesis anti-sigma factor FlgM